MFLLAVLVTAVADLASAGQATIKEDFKPSTLNQPGQEYPQVNSQGYARFRIVAPEAQSVTASLGGGPAPKRRTAPGSARRRPLDEGFHYYHLTIDGGTFNDPGTLNFYGSIRWESGIEIPAHDQDFYALEGRASRQRAADSLPLEEHEHRAPGFVYTPPEYDKDRRQALSRSCTCSTAGARTKPPGATRATPT